MEASKEEKNRDLFWLGPEIGNQLKEKNIRLIFRLHLFLQLDISLLDIISDIDTNRLNYRLVWSEDYR